VIGSTRSDGVSADQIPCHAVRGRSLAVSHEYRKKSSQRRRGLLMSKYVAVIVVPLAIIAWSGCGGSSSSPSSPIYRVPTSTPTPTPTPLPPPTPSPSTMPTPIPTPSPNPYTPPEHGSAICTGEENPQFEELLAEVQWQIINEHPAWFDRTSSAPNTIVINTDAFWKAMLDKINSDPPHIAAHHWRDPMGVISIKNSNRFSENYKVLMSTMAMKSKYADTCRPAEF
jgi:hypothetical protein